MKEYTSYIVPWIITVVRYFVMAGLPFLFFYSFFPNYFAKNKIQLKLARKKDFLHEIRHSIQSTFVFAAVVLILLKSPLNSFTKVYLDVNAYPLWWLPLSLLLALVLHDTYFYWMHRIVHHPKIYRNVHLLHHKSINPSPWASYSFHMYEAILEALIAPLILFLIPIHPAALLLFGLISFVVNVYGHLGYEIAPRWFRETIFFEWIATSTYHNLHHSRFHGNYGLYFRIWDRLLGTENPNYVSEYDRIQLRRFPYKPKENAFKEFALVVIFMVTVGILLANAQKRRELAGPEKVNHKAVTLEMAEKRDVVHQ